MEKISTAEFEIMRAIWSNEPIHTKDIITILKATHDWSDSTVKTLLARLVNKGVVGISKNGNKFQYYSTFDKTKYVEHEMYTLLSKVCNKTKMQVLIDMISSINMSEEDYRTLSTLLSEKQTSKIECDCPKGLCNEKI